MGGWKPLSKKNLFNIEYWPLEQAKRDHSSLPSLTGKVAVVTGAAAGIGLACAKKLHEQGAVVIGLDLNPKVESILNKDDLIGMTCDITNEKKVRKCIESIIRKFGGLDILVNNHGIFTAGSNIEDLDNATWERSLNINLTSARQLLTICIPYMKHGIDPTIIIIGSRNVNAPGAGAAAYSVAKAGLTQLCRVAAMELCKEGVRVNTIHPDAVFDTDLWTPEVLKRSADRYGLTVEQYKSNNLMKKEITSVDVANMVFAMTGPAFAKTTGAQVPVDGGNLRII